jgi:type IV secretory pathway VirB3-like protein
VRLGRSKNEHNSFSFPLAASIFADQPRNIPISTFVYWGAAAYSAVRGKMQKPRGGSRGVVTRSFSGR